VTTSERPEVASDGAASALVEDGGKAPSALLPLSDLRGSLTPRSSGVDLAHVRILAATVNALPGESADDGPALARARESR
jgi:hypothetical protein